VTRNLMFWNDEISAVVADSVAGRDASQCWCNPSAFCDVVGIDFGSGHMHLYSSATGRAWSVPASRAIEEILALATGSLVIGEWAHLATPRTRRSLAQPFSEEQLTELRRDAIAKGITIKLFPHYHSGPRARDWAAARFPEIQSAEKSDSADAMALALYVSHCNGVSLADFPESFARDPKREYGRAIREYSSIALNAERTTGYCGRFFPHIMQLGEEIYGKRGRRIGKTACYSIASLIVTEVNGSPLMFARSGRPPGVEMWWRYVARMTPFHHRAGIARSNLMRHSFRPFLRKFGKRAGVNMGSGSKVVPFGEHDDIQSTTRTMAMKSFRDTAKGCYRDGVNIGSRRGFGMIDPVATPWSEVWK